MDKVYLVVRPSFPSSSFYDVEGVFLNKQKAIFHASYLNSFYDCKPIKVISKELLG